MLNSQSNTTFICTYCALSIESFTNIVRRAKEGSGFGFLLNCCTVKAVTQKACHTLPGHMKNRVGFCVDTELIGGGNGGEGGSGSGSSLCEL